MTYSIPAFPRLVCQQIPFILRLSSEQKTESLRYEVVKYGTICMGHKSKVKGKVLPVPSYAPHNKDMMWSAGTATPFLTLAADGGELSASRPCRFIPGGKKPRYPLDKRLGGPQSRFGCCREEKNLSPAGNRTLAVQPITHRCTDSYAKVDGNEIEN
jgi:hypothetical protein